MKITRNKDNIRPDTPGAPVTLKTAGNILEIRYMRNSHGAPIQRLDKDHYVDLTTGERKDIVHHASRADDFDSVKQSLRKLRDYINANLTEPNRVLWVTLTYAKNMTDTETLYEDYERFWKRFCYYLNKKGFSSAEYIAAAEPQERGAWHLHCFFIFESKAPYIPNSDMERMWKNEPRNESGRGFTKTKKISGIDNPGLYFTAYLADMEYSKAIEEGNASGQITEKEITDENGKCVTKAIVKGARLHLYPSNFNLFRHSKGIKKADILQTTEAEAQKIVGDTPLAYEKTVTFTDDDGEVKNFINYRQYNRARRNSKDG